MAPAPKHRTPTTPLTPGGSAAASSRFPPVQLTSAKRDELHASARTALSHTLKEFVKLDGKPMDKHRWKYLRSRGGVGVYLDRRQKNDTQNSSLLVAGTVPARLGDVMEGLYMDTSEDTRLVQHRFHPRFVDAEVLQVIERRSPAQPYNFTGLKWSMLKSSSTGLVSNRDLCSFEKLGTIDIGSGRTLGYFIMQSVNVRECPPSLSSKVVRAHISLCYLFEELQNGLVGVCMTGSMVSFGPKMLWSLARNNFADVVLSIGNTPKIARAKRYAQLVRQKHEHNDRKRVPSVACELCQSQPSFFERHRGCMGCHKTSVCKRCRSHRPVFQREDHASLRLARGTFCYDCIKHVRDQSDAVTPPPPQKPQHHLHRRDASDRPAAESYANSKPHSFASSTLSTSSDDDSYSTSYCNLDRDSERSLHLFTTQVHQALEITGYDESDLMSRLTGLVVLGDGELECNDGFGRASRATSSISITSSAFLVGDEDERHEQDQEEEDDEEVILSIRPVRRSVQPPEMLEAQKLSRDGSVRPVPSTSTSFGNERDFMSRLARATRLAEETHQYTKAQARQAEMHFHTAPSGYGNFSL